MALRPCITCGVLIPKGSYCRRCIKRGSSGKQATFRRKTLAPTGGKCAVCGSLDGVQAHHPHPVSKVGGGATVGEPLCKQCHRQAHR